MAGGFLFLGYQTHVDRRLAAIDPISRTISYTDCGGTYEVELWRCLCCDTRVSVQQGQRSIHLDGFEAWWHGQMAGDGVLLPVGNRDSG